MTPRLRALFVVIAVATGCRGAGADSPRSAVDAYAEALSARDFDRAYTLTSDAYRRQHTRDEFVSALRSNPEAVKETVARLGAAGRRFEVTARVPYGDLGEELRLVNDDGAWRIDSDPLSFYEQDTPRAALRSFLRAARLGKYDVMMRFVPREYQAHMSSEDIQREFTGPRAEEIETRLNLLRENLSAPIEQTGNHARMPFGDRDLEVRFVREDGLWKIDDLY